MLALAIATLLAGGTAAQRLPDQLDVLRGVDRTPQVKLLIDLSGSMDDAPRRTTPCTFYGSLYGLPLNDFRRIDQVVSVLTGCASEDDGIVDRWASQIVFGVDGFRQGDFGELYPEFFQFPDAGEPVFESDQAALEDAIYALRDQATGGTPMVGGYRATALRFDAFSDSNSEECRENAILLMTDGQGNRDQDFDFDFVTGDPQPAPVLGVRDDFGCFGQVDEPCPNPAPPYLDEAAAYLWGEGPLDQDRNDALPNLDGVQPLRTFAISFNSPAEAQRLLEAAARRGGGEHYPADNYSQLANAFDRAIYQIANTDASFGGAAVQGTGLFSGNFVYQNSFQGSSRSGHWHGNIKKYCIVPDPGDSSCLLLDNGGVSEQMALNPSPVDVWTGLPGLGTRFGGAGDRLWRQMSTSDENPPEDVPTAADRYTGRNIVTWTHDGDAYLPVDPTSLDPVDTFTSNQCEHESLINKLYGYTSSSEACASEEVEFDVWPLGDTVNGGQVLLKYTENCEVEATDRCFLVTVSNTGMLHIFNAVTGVETQAIIPPHFLRPDPAARHVLADITDQPTLEFTRRYYFDGGLTLFHDDLDNNGVINLAAVDEGVFEQETAYLIAGFGRGGRAYIKWNVENLVLEGPLAGTFSASDNPPHPLVVEVEDGGLTGYRYLQDTWAAPWAGSYECDVGTPGCRDDSRRFVAVFPSGHQPELDLPDAAFGAITSVESVPSGDTEAEGEHISPGCSGLGIPEEICSTPSASEICNSIRDAVPTLPAGFCAAGGCRPCQALTLEACQADGQNPPYCYDWPGFEPFNDLDLTEYGITRLHPLQISVGPYRYQSGVSRGVGYRITFSSIDLQPGDSLYVLDAFGNEAFAFTAQPDEGPQTNVQTPWIYSDSFMLRVEGNGVNDREATGYSIGDIDVIRDRIPAPAGIENRPSIYVVDLEGWNGASDGFVGAPTDDRQSRGLVARFTSNCEGTVEASGTCVDAGTRASTGTDPGTSDLAYMTCPISAAPAVWTEGGFLRSIYFGDECGQIWVIRRNLDLNGWSVRRLLTTNRLGGSGETVAGEESRNYRKVFAEVDLVPSTCTGQRSIGVYFGTGNLQRPVAIPSDPPRPVDPPRNLEDADVTGLAAPQRTDFEADVLGVVWDDNVSRYTIDQLVNVTSLVEIEQPTDDAAQRGFFMELREEEKVLRAPLVFEGTAFFQTFQPFVAPNACDDAVARSFSYAFDNCTAAPVRPDGTESLTVDDRVVYENDRSFIGSSPSAVIRSGDNEPIILGGDVAAGEGANLRARIDDGRQGRAVRVYMWRLDVD